MPFSTVSHAPRGRAGNRPRSSLPPIAAGSLLARRCPGQGSRHAAALALAGGLVRAGWGQDDVVRFIEEVAIIAGDEGASDRAKAAVTTARKLAVEGKVTGWPTLGELVGKAVVDRVMDWLGVAGSGFAPTGNAWPAMKELESVLPSVPTLRSDMIPQAERAWIEDASERLQVPPEMIATPAVVSQGAVIGRQVGILPKQRDDWLVVCNAWGAIVGRPGIMKSPAVHEGTRYVSRLAAEAAERFKKDKKKAETDVAVINLKIEELRRRATRRDGDPEGERKNLEELFEAKRNAVAVERRYVTSDATIEKIGELLNENPRGILMKRDELTGWLRMLDRAGREGEREFFLEAWNGVGSYPVDRIGRGTLHVRSLTLSIFGTIQPGKLRTYIADAVQKGSGDDGLLQRFQLLVWPDVKEDFENVDRWPRKEARDKVFDIFKSLDRLKPKELAASEDDSEIPAMRFTPEAQEMFDEWRTALEKRLRSPALETTPAYESHVAKYRSLMPSLALIFHLVDAVTDPEIAEKKTGVSLGAARLAAGWVDFLDAHARRVYAVELDPEKRPAWALSAKIKAGVVRDGDAIRDLYRSQWSELRTPKSVEAGLKRLAELGHVRIVERDTGGRPERVVRLHPDLIRDQGKQASSETRPS